ncbi:hypothetical protein J7T55_009916 [Diaporthe amygdali]|uniref:uncharacterized protein n=1 Tax=Phomopsis amygdali TaxID=1214568 RepID=UPI0022FED8AD|nr:uncharacterized protein J7T55_009916 [Diaporthe amygdali]KAJ0116765.1 hypothetical protein J7T55_009916 [Diaporthe amygdali]
MDILSGDILISVLTELRNTSAGNRDLFRCLLVCKEWNQFAAPILYGNVALRNQVVGMFTHCIQPGLYGERVRSITLRFDPNPTTVDFNKELRLIASVLPKLTKLSSLSLHVRIGWASHEILTHLLEAIPLSCTSLELDTGYTGWGDGQSAHMCDSVRAVLPRMRHARIRTETMCAAMLGTGILPDEVVPGGEWRHLTDPFTPIHLPHMYSLLIVCARHSLIRRCGAPRLHDGNLWTKPSGSAWASITAALERLVETPGAIRQDGASICAVACTDYDQDDMATWKAVVRADVVAKTSWAVPYRMVWHGVIPGSWLVRLPGGRELMTTLENIEQLAEGEEWVNVSGGARLPREIVETARAGKPSFAAGCALEPMSMLKTAAQWRQDNPNKITYIWRNETTTGEKLLEAEKRTGRDSYFSLRPVIERTPHGWIRGYRNESLKRVGALELCS